jgi:isopentenyl-diphosphate delta-isomerase
MIEENVIISKRARRTNGLMPKLEAHEKQFAVLFSFLNSKNEIMLQQRAHHKYHSPCCDHCSHQRAGETNIQAGSRRLFEEMEAAVERTFHFIYKAPFDNGQQSMN